MEDALAMKCGRRAKAQISAPQTVHCELVVVPKTFAVNPKTAAADK
jgi:hypothetical protein